MNSSEYVNLIYGLKKLIMEQFISENSKTSENSKNNEQGETNMKMNLTEFLVLKELINKLVKEQLSSETSKNNKNKLGGHYEEYDENGNLIFSANFKNGLLKGYIEGIGNIALKKPENE